MLRLTAGLGAVLLAANGLNAAEFAGGKLVVQRSEAAADCPDEVELARRTLSLGVLSHTSPEPLSAEVRFDQDASGYVAHVETTGRSEGVREVRKPGTSCAPLAEAVSVVLAVVFDLAPPPAAVEPSESKPAPPPPSAPAAVVAQDSPPRGPALPPREAPPARRTRSEAEFSLWAGVQGGGGYGLLGDEFVGALSGAVRPRFGRWEVAPGVLWAPRRRVTYLRGFVDVGLLSSRVQLCGWLDPSHASSDVAVCVGALLGSLRGSGEGFDEDRSAAEAWLAVEAGFAARVPLATQWALRVGVSTVVPSRPQTFAIAGAGAAFRSSDMAVLMEIGPEVAIP